MSDSFDEMRKMMKDIKSSKQNDLSIEKDSTNNDILESNNIEHIVHENLKDDNHIEQEARQVQEQELILQETLTQENNNVDVEKNTNSPDIVENNIDTTNVKKNAQIDNYKICPNCNNQCNIEAVFCNKCGTKLEIEHKCPNCGTDYTEEDVFCIKCGTKLQEQVPEKTKENQKYFCPVCGTEYMQGDTFCGECGTNLVTQEAFALDNPQTIINYNNVAQQEFHTIQKSHSAQSSKETNYNSPEIKCPYCGSIIERGVKKCPNCGEWLKGGVSHFGCGSIMMLITTIFAICCALGSESLNIPILGEVAGIWLVIIAFLYFLPALIADWRGHDSKFAIFLVNLLFGWTFIGWFIALIFAFTGRSR